MVLTYDELSARLDSVLSPEKWKDLPLLCAELLPQPLRLDEKRMELLAAFDTADWMGNPIRWMHGGMISTIFDNAMGVLASVYAMGSFTPTVTMNVSYLRPVQLDGKVYVLARISKLGRSFIHTSAEMYMDSEALIPHASCTAVYAIHKTLSL